MADALDRHLQPGQLVATEALAHRFLEADEDAVGGRRRRVAAGDAAVEQGARRGADHMAGALGEGLHFGIAGAGVGGGDVAPAEAVDEVAHGVQQRLALAGMRIADDHRLAAAELEPGQRGFQRHPARQPQHIAQGLVVTGIGEHPAATQRRPEARVVDGDDGFQTRRLVMAEDHLLVAVEVRMSEDGHLVTSFLFVWWPVTDRACLFDITGRWARRVHLALGEQGDGPLLRALPVG